MSRQQRQIAVHQLSRCGLFSFMSSGVTLILASIEQGDSHTAEQLLPLVYDELCKPAAKAFERSQTHASTGLPPITAPIRRSLEVGSLNCRLNGAILIREMRKPFDVLAEGLASKNSRDDWI